MAYSRGYENQHYSQYGHQIQRQDQLTGQTGLSDQQKKQRMVEDMVGRSFAEIEAVLVESGVPGVRQDHSSYLLVKKAPRRDRLLNIENNILGLYGFLAPRIEKGGLFTSDKQIESKYVLPEIDSDWINHIANRASQLPPQDPARKVVEFVLKSIQVKKIDMIPPEISDLILSTKERKHIAEDIVKNNQYAALRMNVDADQIAYKIDQSLSRPDAQPSNGKLQGPLYTSTDADNLRRKHFEDPANAPAETEEEYVRRKAGGKKPQASNHHHNKYY